MAGISTSSAVDMRMLRACTASRGTAGGVVRAVEHHLSAGGSRVRANFSLEACRRLGVDVKDSITLAAMCESLHNASLIHDDLMDRAPMRRGSASVWAKFGDSVAVCAGDLLLATAFSLVGDLHRVECIPTVLRLVHQRTCDVILGQGHEQSASPHHLEDYERIAIGKSASLLSLPFELGLLLSENESSIPAARDAAEHFAVAYQMLDDLNDFAEDRQNGSLNAVSVAMDASDLPYDSARRLVCQRAQMLIALSKKDASHLPMQSGSVMISYAEKMQHALSALHDAVTSDMGPLRHGA